MADDNKNNNDPGGGAVDGSLNITTPPTTPGCSSSRIDNSGKVINDVVVVVTPSSSPKKQEQEEEEMERETEVKVDDADVVPNVVLDGYDKEEGEEGREGEEIKVDNPIISNDDKDDDASSIKATDDDDDDDGYDKIKMDSLYIEKIEDYRPSYDILSTGVESSRLFNESSNSSSSAIAGIHVYVGSFKDQGKGNAKAKLYLTLYNHNNQMVERCDIFGTPRTSTDDDDDDDDDDDSDDDDFEIHCLLENEEPIISKAQKDYYYCMEYYVGEGDGHSIYVEEWYCRIVYYNTEADNNNNNNNNNNDNNSDNNNVYGWCRAIDREGYEGWFFGPHDMNKKANGKGIRFFDNCWIGSEEYNNGTMKEAVLYEGDGKTATDYWNETEIVDPTTENISKFYIPLLNPIIGTNIFYPNNNEVFPYTGQQEGRVPKDVKYIKIDKNVTKIKQGEFHEYKQLISVDFSEADNLEEIEEGAFGDCWSLTTIIGGFPKKLKLIGKYAFDYCKELVSIDFSEADNLEEIRSRAFYHCESLTTIIGGFPKKLKLIGVLAFDHCEKLVSIDFSKTEELHTISTWAFQHCESLTTATIPSTVLSFGDNLFHNCNNLNSIDIQSKYNSTTLALAIRICRLYPNHTQKITMQRLVDLYSIGPIKTAEIMTNNDTNEKKKLQDIKDAYVNSIIGDSSLIDKSSFGPKKQNGWVQFLMNHLEDDHSKVSLKKLEKFIEKEADPETIKVLAYAKDRQKRSALKYAHETIREIFEKRLLFLERYDLEKGAPIHKSATCIVIKARDAQMKEYYAKEYKKYCKNGIENLNEDSFMKALKDMNVVAAETTTLSADDDGDDDRKNIDDVIKDYYKRVDTDANGSINQDEFITFCLDWFGDKVAIKIMKNEDQFDRENNCRTNLDPKFVVTVFQKHKMNDDETKRYASHIKPYLSKNENPTDYRFVLVMPFGDRNLNTIFQSERPDMNRVRTYMEQVGESIKHLHDCKILHGDMKMMNIVRTNGSLKSIDMDASAQMNKDEYVGAKFSSGVLPPEMVFCINNDDTSKLSQYEKYFGLDKVDPNSEQPKNALKWTKDVDGSKDRAYMVKTFSPGVDPQTLPYKLVKASEAVDVWSFGIMLYQMCTGKGIFHSTNRDDDITSGEDFKTLYKWTDETKKAKLALINHKAAQNLLYRILKKGDRPSMEKILQDKFFRTDKEENIEYFVKEQTTKMTEVVKNEGKKTREAVKEVSDKLEEMQKQQQANTRRLCTILKGGTAPKYMHILPATDETFTFENLISPSFWKDKFLFTTSQVYFVCPITLEVPLDGEGNPKGGYKVPFTREWVEKWGPTIILSLKLLQVGIGVGRCCGVPLPSIPIDNVCKGLVGSKALEYLASFHDYIREDFGLEEEEQSLVDFTAESIDDAASRDAPEKQKKWIEKSYEEMAAMAEEVFEDKTFENCGLVKVESDDGNTEFVHPDVADLYKTLGKKCFDLSPQELDTEMRKARAAAKVLAANKEKELHDRIKEKEDYAAKQKASISYGREQVAYDGWLEKKGSRFGRWHERYFVIYRDGKVMYYPDEKSFEDPTKIGKIKPAVGLVRAPSAGDEEELLEEFILKCEGEVPDKMLRLSKKRTLSTSSNAAEKWLNAFHESLGKHGESN